MTAPLHLSGKRILVVEDETLISMEIAALLEEAGIEVVGPAGSAEQAETLIATEAGRIDAALLDVNLAGVSAEGIVALLMERRIPFALMTGYAASEVANLAPQAPVVRKPFTPAQVMGTVAAIFVG
jgi:DNA-binding NtrC family response regulator